MPTSAQVADFVEQVRMSGWVPPISSPAAQRRGSERLHLTGVRGDKRARDGIALPVPLASAAVDSLRRRDSSNAFEDELRVVFEVNWDDEDEVETDGANEPYLRPILMVEEEHPRNYTLEVCFARDLVTIWATTSTTALAHDAHVGPN